MKTQETKAYCVLQGREIPENECFDICLVSEYEILPSAFVNGYLPKMTDENREKCLKCPYHLQ